MTRPTIAIAVAASLAAIATPAAAEPSPVDSWGRAGVDFETYRTDAVECASLAYHADVSQTSQAKIFIRGTKQMESADFSALDGLQRAYRYAQIEHSVRPELRMEQLHDRLEGVVADCLTERGYTQFRLTDMQREQLSGLKKGTDERRQFLYMLASDPEVLEQQPVPTAAG